MSKQDRMNEAVEKRDRWFAAQVNEGLDIQWAVKRWSGGFDRWLYTDYDPQIRDGALLMMDQVLGLAVQTYPAGQWYGLELHAREAGEWVVFRPE